jgi:hypothetical protein
VVGSGWPPIKGILGIRCLKVLPPIPLPSFNGEGEDAESGVLPKRMTRELTEMTQGSLLTGDSFSPIKLRANAN